MGTLFLFRDCSKGQSRLRFVSANEGCQEFYWDEYYWHDETLTTSFTIYDFMLVDMDGDQK